MLIFISPLLADYLRHAPCMRLVQAGYERCAADYQTRIKALNEQTQVSIPIRILLKVYDEFCGHLVLTTGIILIYLIFFKEEPVYYDDPEMYEYAYEYADSTEAEYIEEKAEEALETVPNQISKRRRKRASPVKR